MWQVSIKIDDLQKKKKKSYIMDHSKITTPEKN